MQSFFGVNAHHQNGVVKKKIKTMMCLARDMLFTTMTKWPSVVNYRFWMHAIHYSVDILINSAKFCDFTTKELFARLKRDRSLRHCHTFGSPACILDPKLQTGKKLPTWHPRSKPSVHLEKSPNHSSNNSLACDPSANFVLPQFYIVHDAESNRNKIK